MAIGQIKRFGQALVGSGNTLIYTGPSDTIGILRDLAVCNYSASSRTYSLYFVPSGGSVGNSTAIFEDRTLAANVSDTFRFNAPFAAGDKIYAIASAGSSLTLHCSGTEYTSAQLTTWTPTRIVQDVCPTSITTKYTVGTGTRVIIKDVLVANLGSGTPDFDIAVVKSGDSLTDAAYWFKEYALTANQSLQLRTSFVAEAGDTIRLNASGSNAVTVTLNGVVWTI